MARDLRTIGIALVLGLGAMLSGCGSNGNGATTPTNQTVTNFVTTITASDGAVSTSHPGPAPAPNGGPTITATSSGTVTDGGLDVVRIQSTLPFQAVYVFVDGVEGYLQLSLTAATTDTTLVTTIAGNVTTSMYTADYRAAAPSGAVGPSATVPNIVKPSAAPGANITGTWTYQGQAVFAFTQTGGTVTGSEIFQIQPVAGLTQMASGIVRGIVAGNQFSGVNVVQSSAAGSGVSVQCNGTDGMSFQVTSSTMTGTYTQGTITCNIPGFTVPSQLPITLTLTKQ